MEDVIKNIPPLRLFNPEEHPYPDREMIPKLPLLSLEKTLEKYLEQLEALVSNSEFLKAKSLVEEFSNGIGPKAQAYLEQRRKEKENWALEYQINEWYLDFRTATACTLNTGTVLPPRNFESKWDIARYAAALIYTCARQKELIDRKEIPVEIGVLTKQGFCMAQWYYILTSCRVPQFDRDRIVSTLGRSTGQEHVIVAYRNQFYVVVIKRKESDGSLVTLSVLQIAYEIYRILKEPWKQVPAIGLLTAWDRNNWANAYAILNSDPTNKLNIEIIQSSLAVVCVDEPLPDTYNLQEVITDAVDTSRAWRAGSRDEINMLQEILHGGGSAYNAGNRWFDKTLQIIVSKDGVSGINMEHSMCDGVCLMDLCDKMLQIADQYDKETRDKKISRSPNRSTYRLQWNVNTEIMELITIAGLDFDRLIEDLDIYFFRFSDFGKDTIKGLKVSPDVFIQLAIQLAYYKTHGHIESSWESVSTRRFRLGRCEVARHCNMETLKWVEAMESMEKSETSSNVRECLNLLDQAIAKSTSHIFECVHGKGYDVHLLGLKEASKALTGELPAMFAHETYVYCMKYTVGTSQVPTIPELFSGYASIPHGYGCCYNLRNDFIIFCVSSFTSDTDTDTKSFVRALQDSIRALKRLLDSRKEKC